MYVLNAVGVDSGESAFTARQCCVVPIDGFWKVRDCGLLNNVMEVR